MNEETETETETEVAAEVIHKILSVEQVDQMERQVVACIETYRGDGLAEPFMKLIDSHRGLQGIANAALSQVDVDDGEGEGEGDGEGEGEE